MSPFGNFLQDIGGWGGSDEGLGLGIVLLKAGFDYIVEFGEAAENETAPRAGPNRLNDQGKPKYRTMPSPKSPPKRHSRATTAPATSKAGRNAEKQLDRQRNCPELVQISRLAGHCSGHKEL